MHELPITENILEIAVRHGQQANAARVTHLYLVIGQLSSIVDNSIQFYWDIISKDTICEGATLHFERISARLLCLNCGHAYGFLHELTTCPNCDSSRVKVTAGEEFQLQSIEIET
ncbi:MAG: hydrogenase maturation nickel metallochaperone HypA [Chloroflexi bacterium]|nr:hydrogenase maturation nickel metallochaperone HypA [Chloroflexota bacterium]